MIEGKMKSEKKQIEAFHESMESVFKKNETDMAMQHIEWVIYYFKHNRYLFCYLSNRNTTQFRFFIHRHSFRSLLITTTTW